ncbi:MAG: ABC transporter substrate-binding protein [Amylibacter sp.]|nr:ABC transporter substrate-binding protein [Amylibacter sp.]
MNVAYMTRLFTSAFAVVSILATMFSFCATIALGEPLYGIAMYGKPALPRGFSNLPYANPDAPKGGRMVFGDAGGFDSLNPYIRKGRAPWGVRAHVVESLLGRNWDEPFTMYGLLAETVEVGPDREWVAFTLREQARFSDGSPVTVGDVLWSFEILGTKGHPRYITAWKKIKKAEQTGPRSVKFTFNTVDRELPLILGLRPILKKADWQGRKFDESSLAVITGSGPYTIGDFEPNRYISFMRNPDYWGNDLGFNKGRHNLDELRYEYFSDGDVLFEAFKAGELGMYREGNAGKWDKRYNFPAVRNGEITKSIIPDKRPSDVKGFVFNTRRPQFADIRVRDALIHAFNYEFINQTINGVPQPRLTSYFSNSILAMDAGPAKGRVLALLEKYKDGLPSETLEGYSFPTSDGSGRNRRNLRKAKQLLAAAGWTIQQGVLKDADGTPFKLEVLLDIGAASHEAIINIYRDALRLLGITLEITQVDSVQYTVRKKNYDFDMTSYTLRTSLSPGNEQWLYWGREGVVQPGRRNYMGMDSAAAEAMIEAMLQSTEQEDFVAAVKALDRILTSGRYIIPLWSTNGSRLAHKATLHFPVTIPMYGDTVGFAPDVWWFE